ncbi:hypothetical protein BIV57_00340 [Mangrovactinospora gilvigrisea]|uniref:ABC transporter permease n=1 Tax=Mangrovactinospora gilvigrisea TaxID=1428644 RepID=A0A1J7CCR0_9ACTN|nr:ABC transporter ATP-binding protein [Mangrovactinospora gilvigrisea]OIV39332.1 hypothetical protein BIV57_00340 [Mangrovactinospora gilvigrisea]
MRNLRLLGVVLGLCRRIAPRQLTWSLLLGVLGAFASLGIGVGMRDLVDGLAHHNTAAAVTGALVGAVSLALSSMGGRVAESLNAVLAEAVGAAMEHQVLRHSTALPYGALEDPGQLHRLEQARVPGIRMVSGALLLLKVGPLGLQVLLSLILLARTSWWLPALALTALPSLWLARRGERAMRAVRTQVAEDTRMATRLFDAALAPSSAKELALGGGAGLVRARGEQRLRRTADRMLRAGLSQARRESAGWLVFAAGCTAATALAYQLARAGATGPGTVLLVAGLGSQLRGQMAAILSGLRRSLEAMDSLDAYRWLLDQTPDPARRQTAGAPVPARLTDGLTLTGVGFAYTPGGPKVLDGIDLSIPAGSTVALVGEHGSGKTTLVKLLCGLYRPTTGSITVDGIPLEDLDQAAWRGRTTAAFQDFSRWEFRARQTIGVGDLPRIHDTAAIARTAARVGAAPVVDQLPHGGETQLGTTFGNGTELSGGQWQKLALARALLRERPLLAVLDEPTAALDAAAEHAVYQQYAAAARTYRHSTRGITLLVSHRFSTIRMADLIVVLDGGRIAEAGSHAELMANGGLYADLYGLQERAYT